MVGYYNLTPIGETRNLANFVVQVDTQLNGFLGYGIILSFFVVSFISMKSFGWSSKACFASTAFISAILSTFMFLIGIMNETVMLAVVVLAAAGVMSLLFTGGSDAGL